MQSRLVPGIWLAVESHAFEELPPKLSERVLCHVAVDCECLNLLRSGHLHLFNDGALFLCCRIQPSHFSIGFF